MTMSDSAPDELKREPPADQGLEESPVALEASGASAEPGSWKVHAWPVVMMVALLAAGLSYSFFWDLVVHHVDIWSTPPDLWGTFRDAHYIIWDGEGQVYNASTSFVTFPGIAVLLAPVAWLQQHFNLTESWPVYLNKPTAWYVLGPADMLCGGALLFPLDAMARRLSISYKRRAIATVFEAILIYPAVEIWGHPEDVLALAFGCYALLASYDRRWVRSACLYALAVAFQPLILLLLPISLAFVPWKKWPAFGVIMSIPTALLLIPPLIQVWGPTVSASFKQPNFPTIDHATPWLSIAPVLTPKHWGYTDGLRYMNLPGGGRKFEYTSIRTLFGETVAAGPGRTIALVLACFVGVWVARRKPQLVEVVWWAAFALSLRCIFESVIDPNYLVPSFVLLVVVAFTLGKIRLCLTIAAGAVSTKISYWHTGEWRYYLLVMGPLLLALAFSFPGQWKRTEPTSEFDQPVESVA